MTGYSSFSKAIQSATPTGVLAAKYTPSNTVAAACPTVDANWQAASNLPPTPNQNLCQCMYESLTCVVSNSVDTEQYGQLFNEVYGYGVTGGISANGTTGKYGAYGMCPPDQQLSFAFDQYYHQQVAKGNGASACDFKGAASTKSATSPSGTCASLMQQAGTAGTGSVTSSPTGGSGGKSGATSTGAAFPMAAPAAVTVGSWQMGAYILTAALSGMGMILL
jgi:hypothetical protein